LALNPADHHMLTHIVASMVPSTARQSTAPRRLAAGGSTVTSSLAMDRPAERSPQRRVDGRQTILRSLVPLHMGCQRCPAGTVTQTDRVTVAGLLIRSYAMTTVPRSSAVTTISSWQAVADRDPAERGMDGRLILHHRYELPTVHRPSPPSRREGINPSSD
jgi:hypothetical protein